MKDQWVGNNVDLTKLSQRISQFFEQNDLEAVMEQTSKGFRFDVFSRDTGITRIRFEVRILGQSNDVRIEFDPRPRAGGMFSPAMIMGYLTSIFGGGTLLLYDVKQREALDKVEKLFWHYVDEQIPQLINSAAK